MPPTPRAIADRQLAAYNARDLDAFAALFAPDAVLTDLPSGAVVAAGAAAIRDFYRARFATPGLRARVHAKIDLADWAADRETVYGIAGGPVDILALYEVKDGLIRRVFFIRETAADG